MNNLTPQQRYFIISEANHRIDTEDLSALYHNISSIEQSFLLDQIEGLPDGSFFEVQGSLGTILGGTRIFWYKLGRRELYQVETNLNVDECRLVASLNDLLYY